MKIGYSYHGNTFFDHFQSDIQEMKALGATYIVQTFSENNMEFNVENFQKMNEYAQSQGLEVHIDPWSLAGIFGGEAYSKFVINNLDTWQKNNLGELIPLACLNHPKTQDFIRQWIDVVRNLNIDYIFWDEPHFWIQVDPTSPTWACRCEICQRKFQASNGREMPLEYSEKILTFKRNSIKEFLNEMTHYAKDKGLKNGLCVLPPNKGASFEAYWRDLVSTLPLAYFGTDPYWLGWNRTIEEMLVPLTETVQRLCKDNGIESQIWLQGFKVMKEKIPEWEKGLIYLLASSTDRLGVWSYKCCQSLSYLDFGTSERLWDILKEKVCDKL